ncbi:hypothetical protein [Natrialbaceae archaeon AArc-T1-2]|uniref:hypothetical protein n=1 Tax=Natrialbaceae archaeon AArc-T1-2 TaxID=3053904 RepID=UPI00255B14C4|nr:hypothetical protein [Natrialbaceae archaeon AArc-T1-2]WIV66079.1 hypothetical protein QQ977_10275 [Natrialbaceae archaeon AArc-T1-2]
MSDHVSWRRVSEHSRSLSLAVSLWDDLTRNRPDDDPRITVDGVRPAVRTPSGYHLYFDLSDRAVEVAVDGGDQYMDDARTVDLGKWDQTVPLEFNLQPTTAYPFPSWATLVRGRVMAEGGSPVAEAAVSVKAPGGSGADDSPWQNRIVSTDETGHYVYYFRVSGDAADGDTSIGDGSTVEIDGEDPTFRVVHDGRVEETSLAVAASDMTELNVTFSRKLNDLGVGPPNRDDSGEGRSRSEDTRSGREVSDHSSG